MSSVASSDDLEPKLLSGPWGLPHTGEVREGLHLERVAARIAEEHRRLLAGLSLEAHVGLDHKLGARGA